MASLNISHDISYTICQKVMFFGAIHTGAITIKVIVSLKISECAHVIINDEWVYNRGQPSPTVFFPFLF